MASIPLTELSIASVKKALRTEFSDVRSSHLSEALAASLRRKTYAALRGELASQSEDPAIEFLDEDLFNLRLQELGYLPAPEFCFELVEDMEFISTIDPNAWDISYRTNREKAWRNLMVFAINEGIRQKLFSLRPDDNRWPNADQTGALFDFALPNGLPARGYVSDAGFAELGINVAVNPKGNMVKAYNGEFYAGDAFASGWLERQRGVWLQSATTQFNCRNRLLPMLVGLEVKPLGYGDYGKVIV